MLAADGPGSAVDCEGKLKGALEIEGPWKTLVLQKDNFAMNKCLVALQQKALNDSRATIGSVYVENPMTILDLNCMWATS